MDFIQELIQFNIFMEKFLNFQIILSYSSSCCLRLGPASKAGIFRSNRDLRQQDCARGIRHVSELETY